MSKSKDNNRRPDGRSPDTGDFKLPKLTPGLLIYYGIKPEEEALVRAAIEHSIRTGSSRGAVRFRGKRNVTALHPGTRRAAGFAGKLAEHFVKDPEADIGSHEVENLASTSGRYDWSSAEARHMLKERIKSADGHCVTFSLQLNSRAEQELINTLGHVADDAERAKGFAACFVAGPEGFAQPLVGVGTDAVKIGCCDPSPGAVLAFSEASLSAQPFYGLGVGHVMCDVYLSKRRARRVYSPFLSERLDTRFMSLLKSRGLSNEQIGEVFGGLSRTTIARRLEPLPPLRETVLNEGWIESYATRLDLDVELIQRLLAEEEGQ